MSTKNSPRPKVFRFGIRHAIAMTMLFAALFLIATPRLPKAPALKTSEALTQIANDNILAAEFRRPEVAYLTLKEPVADEGEGTADYFVVHDPDHRIASALEAARVPFSIHDPRPAYSLVPLGGVVIMLTFLMYRLFIRVRQNR